VTALAARRHAAPATAGQVVLEFATATMFAAARLLWAMTIVALVVVGGAEHWS